MLSFGDTVEHCLEGMPYRARYVVLTRNGGTPAKRMTLQELANQFGVTRERIRQIEKRGLKDLHKAQPDWFWNDIRDALSVHGGAAPLYVIEAEGDRLSGLASYSWLLKAVTSGGGVTSVHIATYNGLEYMIGTDIKSWKRMLTGARSTAAALVEPSSEGVRLDTLSAAIASHFPLEWFSAARLARDEIMKEAVVAEHPSGNAVVLALKSNLPIQVAAVLLEADAPLHFTEIQRRLQQRLGKKPAVLRVQAVCIDTPSIVLLGRGTYGLARHVRLNQRVQKEVADTLEAVFANGDKHRQWHAHELLSIALESVMALPADASAYDIAFVVEQHCVSAVPLGRMVFQSVQASHPARIDVRQAIVSILSVAGQPLDEDVLLSRLQLHRGISHFAAILQSTGEYARLSSGKIGLVARDFGLSLDDAEEALRDIYDECLRCGRGLHISEIAETVQIREDECPDITRGIIAHARRSDRLKLSVAGYLYPSNWDGPNRLSVNECIARLAAEKQSAPWTLDSIHSEVVQETGRNDLTRSELSQRLSTLDNASYDQECGFWTLKPSSGQSGTDQ